MAARVAGCPAHRVRRGRFIRASRPACVTARPEISPSRYTAAVGLLVPRSEAFDARHTLAVFDAVAGDVPLELPRDLPQISDWPRSRLDGDHYQHRVALALADGSYELLDHVCPCSRAHAGPGHHSWGDSGHEADDLAYSLLCTRYGGRFTPGRTGPDPAFAALLLPGLFEVIARLSRGHGWRMRWDQLLAITAEPTDAR